MLKQLRLLLLKCLVWFICCLMINVPASLASSMENRSASPLSLAGLTDEKFESEIKKFIGTPYRRGGTSVKGMDCSGFVRLVYDQLFGIELPHNSVAQFKFTDLEKIDRPDMQKGDLVFFSDAGKKRINHVGVYMSNNKFIHASSSKGIKISRLDDRYWKKRFAGSKRHAMMNSNLDEGKIRFESSLSIPVHDNGTISSYRRDEFTINRPGIRNSGEKVRGFTDSPVHLHEVGYTHTLFDGFDLNMSALHERFNVYTAWPEIDLDTQIVRYHSDKFSSDSADRTGLRLAGGFKPSDWLSISPSITFFDYSRENEDILNAPEWLFGLNTVLLPLHKRWSLSMLLQYSEKDDLRGFSSSGGGFSSLDMAIKLGIHITENLQLTIIGEHDKQTGKFGVPGDAPVMKSETSDVSMSINVNY